MSEDYARYAVRNGLLEILKLEFIMQHRYRLDRAITDNEQSPSGKFTTQKTANALLHWNLRKRRIYASRAYRPHATNSEVSSMASFGLSCSRTIPSAIPLEVFSRPEWLVYAACPWFGCTRVHQVDILPIDRWAHRLRSRDR